MLNISHQPPKPPSRWFSIASWATLIVLMLLLLALMGNFSDERMPPPAERVEGGLP